MADEMSETRSEVVKCGLTPTEFIAFSHLCERLGLSQAAAIRMWVREAIERHSARDSAPVLVLKRAENGPE